MTSPTNYFVDPLGGNDGSGDGSIGNPWATVQHALDNITRDTTNGDQINVRDTAEDVLTNDLDPTTYGSPGILSRLVIRGYTNTANDGGRGGIDGNGNPLFVSANNTVLVDMRFHNYAAFSSGAGGASKQGVVAINCVFEDGPEGVQIYQDGALFNCYFNNLTTGIAGSGPSAEQQLIVDSCFFDNVNYGVSCYRVVPHITNCTFVLAPSSLNAAVYLSSLSTRSVAIVSNNTIYGSGAAAIGIDFRPIQNSNVVIKNNIIAGFSGVGGVGIRTTTSSNQRLLYGNNAFYNNTTNESVTAGQIIVDLGGNQYLSTDPFVDAANNDFTLVDDTLAVGAWPVSYLVEGLARNVGFGAVQYVGAGGGRRPRLQIFGR